MKIVRRKCKIIKIGNISIGENYPIAIQSMLKTKTSDIEKTVKQIQELEGVGCEIVRVAVKDTHDARAIKKIKKKVGLAIVADIHFNWRLALESIDNGADKIRLNPGNIYKEIQIKEVVRALKAAHIPLRVGVNSGSVRNSNNKSLSMPDKLVMSCLRFARVVEKLNFYDMVISLKASNVLDTVEAYRKISTLCDYPLHLGVTATGLPLHGVIKSSIAVGSLLLDGLGDTIRISLTDDPINEVKVAKIILESLDIRTFMPVVISCPTCGRCEVDLVRIVKELESKLSTIDNLALTRPMKLALMGCVVNGPGEAKEADVGIAFGKKQGLLFKNGRAIKKVSFSNCIATLLKQMEELSEQGI
jgi:(E)-4-hydroxy-3-methylbut-2-enyl-diphosphate synthase